MGQICNAGNALKSCCVSVELCKTLYIARAAGHAVSATACRLQRVFLCQEIYIVVPQHIKAERARGSRVQSSTLLSLTTNLLLRFKHSQQPKLKPTSEEFT